MEFDLAPRDWELVTVSPLQRAGDLSWAPIGLLQMLNGGGAVISSSLHNGLGPRGVLARMVLRAGGLVGAYCSERPVSVRANGAPVEYEYDELSGLLTIPLPRAANLLEVSVRWRAGW